MDKAKAILADKSISTTYLANITDISRYGVLNYRSGKTDIEKAAWTIVTKLARAYEVSWITTQIGDQQTEFVLFIKKLTEQLTIVGDQLENKDPAMADTIDLLKDMTISEITQLIVLFKNYQDD
ncbi:hypothetical protein FC24_GL000893 [Loigolactobacillus rennini DSM 20253]|uniref:Uncharacterized protein n=2 Tax=Loigolactobacillus rennini TaxID=238013 RepID=A0A0R2CYP8_9LACO|nr:hypothetical protein FC24_GL000893 [Loigolactobacillus rennini DSM 20253]